MCLEQNCCCGIAVKCERETDDAIINKAGKPTQVKCERETDDAIISEAGKPTQIKCERIEVANEENVVVNSESRTQQKKHSSCGVELRFKDTTFRSIYQRNNKRGGLKNLRCFPNCGAQHKERGFCGRAIKVEVENTNSKAVVCWGQFVRADQQDNRAASVNPCVGDRVSAKKLESLVRSPSEVTKPFVRGEALEDVTTKGSKDTTPPPGGSVTFCFNKKLKGWHYGWAANKHSCNAEHVFKVYAMEATKDGSNDLVCRATVASPRFMLFCRRRRRFQITPSAPIAKPTQSKKSAAATIAKAAPVPKPLTVPRTSQLGDPLCCSPIASCVGVDCTIEAPLKSTTSKRKREAMSNVDMAMEKRMCLDSNVNAETLYGLDSDSTDGSDTLSTYSTSNDLLGYIHQQQDVDMFHVDVYEPLPALEHCHGVHHQDEIFALHDLDFGELIEEI